MDEQRAWIKSRRKKWLRFIAAMLALCLLVTTYPNILETFSVLAAGSSGKDEVMSIYDFAGLPEEISRQTVPMGTPVEELALPETLEAYVIVEEKPDDEAPVASEQNKGDKEEPDDGEDENGSEEISSGDENSSDENGSEETSDSDEDGSDENGREETSDGDENGEDENGSGETSVGDENSSDENGSEETSGGENDADSEEDSVEGNSEDIQRPQITGKQPV